MESLHSQVYHFGKSFQDCQFFEPHQAASSGDHLEATKKAGYKDTHTLRNQACKLRRECADEITKELHRNFAEIAPRALNILSDLAENAESESVRLRGNSRSFGSCWV